MKTSQKIKLIRNTHGMSQEEFCELLGVSRSHLGKVELGKTEPIPLLINCISLMFNVDKNWLIDDNNSDLTPLTHKNALANAISMVYSKLNIDNQKIVESMVQQLLDAQDKKNE